MSQPDDEINEQENRDILVKSGVTHPFKYSTAYYNKW